MSTKENNKNIPFIGEHIKRLWNCSAIFWLITYHAVNILAFSSSILVILLECFSSGDERKEWIVFLSAMAAILTFVACALNCKNQYPRYRKAFNVLNTALLQYYAHPDDPTKVDNIVEAISRGEDIIDGAYDIEDVDRNKEKREKKIQEQENEE